MTKDARRAAIVDAVAPVFARMGLHGATTKALAAAAGVSEALLYQHFTSKEALYAAIGERLECDAGEDAELEALRGKPPSTERLVRVVEYLVSHAVREGDEDTARLTAQSLLGDGAYAKEALEGFRTGYFELLLESARAAEKAKDLVPLAPKEELPLWVVHHLVLALRLCSLPKTQPAPYGAKRSVLIRAATQFALRGLGLRKRALRQYLG